MPTTARSPGRPEDPELKARREEEILAAAAKLFAERGYADTQMQTLADHLGVGNGTIYRYFPTKEVLFLATVERGLAELTAEMDAIIAGDGDPLDQMRDAVRAYLRFFHRRPEMAELFIQERAAFRQHHRPLYFVTKAEDDCKHAEFFAKLHKAGIIRDLPPERFFNVVGDLLYGIVLTNLLSGRGVDPDAQADDVLDVIFLGVFSDAARKKHNRKRGT
ncbi:MAG: TetR/AcrR family transcriptional regulator [Fimbriiglobus sp.]|jgi:AcrR family transcriptional regulator|nr:TetR/AcrR family transcriptional regulator [Fimbriiglobus sp.]